jgi:magnesium transporter
MPEEASDGDGDDPAHLMLLILLKIDADYDRFIHDSSRQIRRWIEHMGTREIGPKSFIRFVHVEDDMNDFLGSLVPTNAVLRHLVADSSAPGFATHRELVDTVILNNEQSIQTCDANLKSLAAIRRTYTLINGYTLDRTIKILTLASVFIAIPTMFFSFYGMNIPLPWQHHPIAYVALLLICLLVAWSAYAIGRKKRVF